MIVNVCPAAVSRAPAEKIWSVLTNPERLGDWADARFVSAEPSGPAQPGQVIRLSARELGREWPVRIEVRDTEPRHRWIDWVAHLPFGVENHQRTTLTETPDGGTLVRFN